MIHALSWAIDVPAPVDTFAQRESFIQAARFVGREEELDQLTTAMHQIEDRHSSDNIWFIGGESGVGKSRLLDEIRTHALLNGVTVLFDQAKENSQTPLHVWQTIVKHLILMTSHEADELAVFQTVFGDINRLLDQSIPVVPDGTNIQRLFTTHLNMLLNRHNMPLLLLMEDLQWANESLQVLETLITSSHPGLMIIGTYRNDEAPDLPDRFPQANRMTLNRLSSDEIQSLSVSILGETGHQQQVTSFLERETQGNAFFIVEVIRALAESAGHLSAIGRVTLDEQIFTEGMRRLIRRRLDQLPDVYQPLLRLAAVQGRQLDMDLLATLYGDTFQSFLYAAAEAGILDVRDNRWRFAHDKFREAVLAALTETEKMALHRRIAMTIEQRLDDPMNQAGMLAFHWGAAGAVERESPYLLKAARTAFQSSLFQDAWNWMQRVIEIDAWMHVASTPRDKARFLREVGSTAYQLGYYDVAIEYHQEAYQILAGLSDWLTLAEILGSLGDILALIGRFDESETHLTAALVYAYASSDDERTGIVLMNLAALEARRNNMPDAISIMQQSYEHLKRTDNQVELAKALNNVALGYTFQGAYERSLTYHQQALNLRRQLNDRHGLISSNRNLASLYMHHFDDPEQAGALLEEARQIAEQLALHEDRIAVWSILADLAQKQGHSSQAEEYLLESVLLARRIQNPVFLAEQLRQQSDFYYDKGEVDLAAAILREALKIRHDQSHSRPQDVLIARSARLLEKQHQRRAALSLLVYAEKQDVLDSRDELPDLYRDLQTTLPAGTVAEAFQKGQKMSRAEASEWLLEELLQNDKRTD